MKKIILMMALLSLALTACSGVVEYTITFETDGGSELSPLVLADGAVLSLPANPTKEGYLFDGWYLDSEYQTPYVENEAIGESITLYAKWIEASNLIQVTFFDGDTVVDTVDVIDFTIPEFPDTSKEGYTFKGWFYDQNFARPYNDSITIFNSFPLYGRWNINVDVLLYNTSDDTYLLEDFSGLISELPVPTLTGYVFAGWFLDPELTERPLGTETFLEDTTVYAKWTPALNNVYLLYEQYVLGRFLLGYEEEFELTDVTLNGFTFMGWYSDIELTTPITTITGINETMYVYGKYEQEVMNFPPQTNVDLSNVVYESYLDSTNPVVHITVADIGTMSLQLFPSVAKNTVDNFIFYIESEAYQGSSFHRIIEDFMIQGGIVSNTACPIEGQFTDNGLPNDVSHTRGALSMARTSVMNSATSQFFIVHNDSLFLDGSYATFGGLVNGFDVLDYLATLTTSSTDAPIRDVIIEDVTIEYNGYVPGTPICAS